MRLLLCVFISALVIGSGKDVDYTVYTHTCDVVNAETTADIQMQLLHVGQDQEETSIISLRSHFRPKSETDTPFIRGQYDGFQITALEIEEINAVRFWHNKGGTTDMKYSWCVDIVLIDQPTEGFPGIKHTNFYVDPSKGWLSGNEENPRITITIKPTFTQTAQVTQSVLAASTNFITTPGSGSGIINSSVLTVTRTKLPTSSQNPTHKPNYTVEILIGVLLGCLFLTCLCACLELWGRRLKGRKKKRQTTGQHDIGVNAESMGPTQAYSKDDNSKVTAEGETYNVGNKGELNVTGWASESHTFNPNYKSRSVTAKQHSPWSVTPQSPSSPFSPAYASGRSKRIRSMKTARSRDSSTFSLIKGKVSPELQKVSSPPTPSRKTPTYDYDIINHIDSGQQMTAKGMQSARSKGSNSKSTSSLASMFYTVRDMFGTNKARSIDNPTTSDKSESLRETSQ